MLALALVSLSCNFLADLQSQESASPAELESATQNADPTSEPQPTEPEPVPPTASPKPKKPVKEATPTADTEVAPKSECNQDLCIYDGVFLLERPIGSQGRNVIDPSTRFGYYQQSLKAARHGVNFVNSTGTPVLAAADGTVVVAGDDNRNPLGLYKGQYGNLVVLAHNLPGVGSPVYSLYSQLSETNVQVGDQVKSGERIGRVGSSGNVNGSTLHFEVRMGDNFYDAVRNPELWLAPLRDESGQRMGALAGKIVDANGKDVIVDNIVIERLAGPGQRALDTYYLKTYAEKKLKSMQPWEENFAMGDLPAGEYQITFYSGPNMVQREVVVEPGKLTVIKIQVP